MPLLQFASAVARIPSVTNWTRLEPRPREGSMQRSLQAQVRDPLWFLARQWQVAEFTGADAGSPIQATIGLEQRNLTTYRPGPDDTKTTALDAALPVEVHAERETVTLRLRGAVQLGLRFENLLRAAPIADPHEAIAAFRAAFPIAAIPDPAYADSEATRFRAVAAGRVTDGQALYISALAVAQGRVPPVPLPPVASDPAVAQVLAAFVALRQALFSEPAQDSAWQSQQLDYAFAVGSPVPGQELLLSAPTFPGGHLDWYSFDLAPARTTQAGEANPATITPVDVNFIPNHVVFRGMPDPRWWNFEDGVTDFGQLDADHVDLPKLLVMEFALIYGNDWFTVPVPTPVGTLERVITLVVTDTFGVRTVIRPAEQTTVNPRERPWSMFKLSSAGTRSDFITMAPTLGLVDDTAALEEVLFLRDDLAAMAWAVEHRLQGDLDVPIDGYEIYLRRIKADPPPPAPVQRTGGPSIYYTLETVPPDNWIPMVPVSAPSGELLLRRGTMEVPTASGLINLTARGAILEPGHPFFVSDRVVARSGVLVDRYIRRTRAANGGTLVWMARSATTGRGPGWSGLRFDLVRGTASA